MIRIALVGKIGSGKTYVSRLFKFPIFNADKQVKKIYRNNKSCFKKLNKKFPKYIKSFPIKKTEILRILNKQNIKKISKIVHPYVRKDMNRFLKKNKKKKYVMLDIPLLVENKLYKEKDIIFYVKASKKNIDKRLKKRGNYNKKIIKILRSQQANQNKKIKISNFIINNNLDKKNLLKNIKKIKNTILC